MSAAIGASATGRARLHRDREPGAPLHGRGALQRLRASGLPIVMTVANRAIGAPINIWNDHSRLDVAARLRLDPALRRVEPGGRRPARPGVPARRGALAAGDGLHGRLHPHARLRAGRPPEPGAGRRLPAAVRAAPGARPRRPDDDRRDGRPRGVHRGQVPHAREADAGARRDPRDRRRVRAGVRPQLRRARPRPTAARTPRPSSSRSAPCSARSRTSSTSCASEGVQIGASASSASGRSRSTRCAPRSRHAARVVVRREGVRGRRSAGSSARTCGSRSSGSTLRVYDVVAGLGGRPITKRSLRALFADVDRPSGSSRRGCTSSTSTRELVERELRAHAERRRSGPHAENILRDLGGVAAGRD